jgi:pimeloyl-ACP methyl ester carboxylesterase
MPAAQTPSRIPPKSTNVRVSPWVRRTFGLLSLISPALTAAVAERLFFTPPPPRRSRGEELLGRARRFRVSAAGRRVEAWRWGRGPLVMLVHGWGGRAAQLTSFVAPLVARGFSVVAFDAPGHGRSGRGLSSAVDFACALRAVAGGRKVHGILAHSLGAAAAALAMRDGLHVGRVVFLGPVADPPSWVAPFAASLGISTPVVARLQERSERRLGLPWRELRLPELAQRLDAPLLVVHDDRDVEVPLRDGAAIAAVWPAARLLETTGLGHNGALRDPDVVTEAVAHLTDGVATCPCGVPVEGAGMCLQCRLDRELFDRDVRWAARTPPAARATSPLTS